MRCWAPNASIAIAMNARAIGAMDGIAGIDPPLVLVRRDLFHRSELLQQLRDLWRFTNSDNLRIAERHVLLRHALNVGHRDGLDFLHIGVPIVLRKPGLAL